MRIYNIPVNADLLEMVMPIDDEPLVLDALSEFNQTIRIMHDILETEYFVKMSGPLASAVCGRGAVYRIGEMR